MTEYQIRKARKLLVKAIQKANEWRGAGPPEVFDAFDAEIIAMRAALMQLCSAARSRRSKGS